jgi:hypothetical protein
MELFSSAQAEGYGAAPEETKHHAKQASLDERAGLAGRAAAR